MKTLTLLCLALVGLAFVLSCDQFDDSEFGRRDKRHHKPDGFSSKDKFCYPRDQKEVPFKAVFYTKRSYEPGPGGCSEAPYLSYNLQIGEGYGTHLGKFSTTIWFCGNGFDYKSGEGVFIAANGDELYFQVPSPDVIGHILPYEHSLYEYTFADPFIFTGGTGRFEGASGGGTTDSYVDLFDDEGNLIAEHQTDHTWKGTLVLPTKKFSSRHNGKDWWD